MRSNLPRASVSFSAALLCALFATGCAQPADPKQAFLAELRDIASRTDLSRKSEVEARFRTKLTGTVTRTALVNGGEEKPNFARFEPEQPVVVYPGVTLTGYGVDYVGGVAANSEAIREGQRPGSRSRFGISLALDPSVLCIRFNDVKEYFDRPTEATQIMDGGGLNFGWQTESHAAKISSIGAYFGASTKDCTSTIYVGQIRNDLSISAFPELN